MLEPWNDKSLSPPPVHTTLSVCAIDLTTIEHILKNIINVLSKQSPFHKESAIFSRLLYKFDKKFRNDIGYRFFKKVNCALKRYLLINLLKDIEQFKSVLPEEEDEPCYVPTKQMLEYVLIRLISFSKLMVRIVVCSKQAAVFYLDRVKRGESHWMSLMPYALLSRVWSMAFVLLQHACNWYKLLYPFLGKLQLKGLKFLPENYDMPVDLEDWLEINNINDFGRLNWTKKDTVNVNTMLINDGEDFENILQYVSEINEHPTEKQDSDLEPIVNKNTKKTETNDVLIKKIDYGEAISRDTFKKLLIGAPINDLKDDYFHVIDKVTDKKSLQTFIDKEEIFRNEGNSRSLTNHLSFMQWQSLKLSLSKLENLTLNNRKLQRRFQKIWQEKCLDVE